jgi:sec-independent protein translocase protein TatA
MGFGVTELLIILAIVLVLFGAKKLRNIGGDLGGAIKNFKTAMNDGDGDDKPISDKKISDSIEKGSIENNTSDATFDTSSATTSSTNTESKTTESKTKETV